MSQKGSLEKYLYAQTHFYFLSHFDFWDNLDLDTAIHISNKL